MTLVETPTPKREDLEKHIPWDHCKTCGSPPREHEVKNFDRIARDGDVYCKRCGSYVRYWDPN